MRHQVRLIAVLGLLLAPAVAPAQTPAKPAAPAAKVTTPAQRKAAYAALGALPDWSGVWSPDWSTLFPRGATPPAPPPYTDAAKKLLADYRAGQAKGENLQNDAANCVPPGMPGIMHMPYPIEFMFTPGRVTIFAETDSQARRVYINQKQPDDPDPSFNGSSVGHWEGDTLVVDTIALNPKNSISGGIKATENTKIEERIHLKDADHIIIDQTITDPSIYTTPYTSKQAYVRKPGWEIREYVCEENNHDKADEFGRPSMSIN